VRFRAIAFSAAGLVGGAFAANEWLAAGRRRPRPAGRSAAAPAAEATRAELYEAAKRLEIPGRSKMSRAELDLAVSRRRAGAGAA